MNTIIEARRTDSERTAIFTLLGALALACWAYLLSRSPGPPQPAALAAAAQLEQLARVAGLWAATLAAIMLPAAAPAALAFARTARGRYGLRRPYLRTALFTCGLAIAWCGWALAAALAQRWLQNAGLLDADLALSNPDAGALLMVAAGAYQWTPVKQACLEHCRAPHEVVLACWRPGLLGAIGMGIDDGKAAAGCYWPLTALLFVAGVTNLAAIAALGVLVLAEKPRRAGTVVACFAGLLLVAWGTRLLFP
ncbi:MAG: DUF2182 domain-containing protein [Massilia sp.]